MRKHIDFRKDTSLADRIQDYANKHHNGNFTEAFKRLAEKQLGKEKKK